LSFPVPDSASPIQTCTRDLPLLFRCNTTYVISLHHVIEQVPRLIFPLFFMRVFVASIQGQGSGLKVGPEHFLNMLIPVPEMDLQYLVLGVWRKGAVESRPDEVHTSTAEPREERESWSVGRVTLTSLFSTNNTGYLSRSNLAQNVISFLPRLMSSTTPCPPPRLVTIIVVV